MQNKTHQTFPGFECSAKPGRLATFQKRMEQHFKELSQQVKEGHDDAAGMTLDQIKKEVKKLLDKDPQKKKSVLETLSKVFAERGDKPETLNQTEAQLLKTYLEQLLVSDTNKTLDNLSAEQEALTIYAMYKLDVALRKRLGIVHIFKDESGQDHYVLIHELEPDADDIARQILQRQKDGEELGDILNELGLTDVYESEDDIPPMKMILDRTDLPADITEVEVIVGYDKETISLNKDGFTYDEWFHGVYIPAAEEKERRISEGEALEPGKFGADTLLGLNQIVTVNSAENLRNPETHKKIGTAQAGEKYKVVGTAAKRGRYEYALVQKIGKGGVLEPTKYKLCLNDGNRVSVEQQEDPTYDMDETIEKIYADTVTINSSENLRDPNKHTNLLGKAKAGEKYKVVGPAAKRGRYEYALVQKIGKGGVLEPTKYKLCLNDGNRVSVGVPAEVKRLFAEQKEIGDLRKLRSGSSKQFENWIKSVDDRVVSKQKKAELIAAFKVLDVSYARIRQDRPLARLAALDQTVQGLKKGSVKELFAENFGTGSINWKSFYETFESNTDPRKHRGAVEDILRGGTLFMLRIDQVTHGGPLEASIDTSLGGAWADNVESFDGKRKGAAEILRGEKDYVYKYLEIRGGAKNSILESQGIDPDQADNYQVAQIEIPNCENPAIVIKNLTNRMPEPWIEFSKRTDEKPIYGKTEVPEDICDLNVMDASLLAVFKNVKPLGLVDAIFRSPDWFRAHGKNSNYKLDRQIKRLTLDETAPSEPGGEAKTQEEIIRPSEQLEARKRLKQTSYRPTHEHIDNVLRINRSLDSADRGSNREKVKKFDSEWDTELRRWEKKKFKGQKYIDLVDPIAPKLDDELNSIDATDATDRLEQGKEIFSQWKKKYPDQIVDMATYLNDRSIDNMAQLAKKMKREADAETLMRFGNGFMSRIDSEKNNDKENGIEGWTLAELIKQAGYKRIEEDGEHDKFEKTSNVGGSSRDVFHVLMEQSGYESTERDGKIVFEKADDKADKLFELMDEDSSPIREVMEAALFDKYKLNARRPHQPVLDRFALFPQQPDQINVLKFTSGFREALNTDPMILSIVRLILFVTGIATSLPMSEVPDFEDDKLPDDLKDVFDSESDYQRFVKLLETGTYEGQGCEVIALPVDEWELMLPGWRILTKLFKGSGSASQHGGGTPGQIDPTGPIVQPKPVLPGGGVTTGPIFGG